MARPRIYDDGLTPQQRYQRAHTKNMTINFNMQTESALYDHVQSQPNKQGYIKQLVRDDMEKSRK